VSGWLPFISDSLVKGRKAEGCDGDGDGDGDGDSDGDSDDDAYDDDR